MTPLQFLNIPRKDGFPKIEEISARVRRIESDAKNPVFLKPINEVFNPETLSVR